MYDEIIINERMAGFFILSNRKKIIYDNIFDSIINIIFI